MRKNLPFLLLLFSFVANAQTIRIADNNANAPTGTNIFSGASALQNAINAAQVDDIVYIQPSITSYGDATVGKRIIIKGAGFGIAELGPRSSTVGTLTVVNSDNGTNSISGAKFTGFIFTSISFAAGTGGTPHNNLIFENISGGSFNHTACVAAVDNLILRNSLVNTINIGNCSGMTNTKIYNTVITSQLTVGNNTDPLITNNLLTMSANPSIVMPTSTGVRIEHNILSGSGSTFSHLVNALVVNNIFYGQTPGAYSTGVTFRDNTFSNNLVLAAFTFPVPGTAGGTNSGVGNIAGTGPLFTNAPVATAYNATYDYTLSTGSPCIAAATTGDNIGPSGGLYPWTGVLKLRASAIPVITLFGNSGVVPQNQPLKSNIKAKSN